jgi:hypothetical protein
LVLLVLLVKTVVVILVLMHGLDHLLVVLVDKVEIQYSVDLHNQNK